MKTKIALTGIAALMASVAGANAAEIKPFVGLSLGLQELAYSSEVKKEADGFDEAGIYQGADAVYEMPTDFIDFGVAAGVRFGAHNQIYNGGFTVNADWTSSSDVKTKLFDLKLAEISTQQYSVTYDNYIRLSGDKARRIDLVLGLGAGTIGETMKLSDLMKLEAIAAGEKTEDKEWSPTIVFKVGADFEVTKHLYIDASTRFILPTRSHPDIRTSYIFGGTVKYLF